MNTQEIIQQLINLAQLDIDAFRAYGEAIEHIEIQEVKNRLTEFQADHQRHVDDLTPIIVRMGGHAPEFKPDF